MSEHLRPVQALTTARPRRGRELIPAYPAKVGLALCASLASACGSSVPAELTATSRDASAAQCTAAQGALPLSVPADLLSASLRCSANLASAGRSPLLLVHGTFLDGESNWSWNYVPWLESQQWPYCTVDLPDYATADAQTAAEYLVHAIRQMAGRSGHQVQIIGYSQGAMLPRWALKFWPDTRALVDDLVGFAPTNHGTVLADTTCSAQGSCSAASWQQRSSGLSTFIDALNAGGETWPEPSYTTVYSHYDEVATPNAGPGATSPLSGGANVRNVALQDVCPGNTAEHLVMPTDPVAFAVALDALSNAGPADPARVALTVCAETFMPGVDPAAYAENFANMVQVIGEHTDDNAVSAEPPLKCYVPSAG